MEEDYLYVSLPLFSDAYYGYSATLEGNSYQLRFTYNETMQLYTMSIYDAALNLLVGGIAVVPNYPMIADYYIPGLTGFFVMVPKGSVDKEYYKLYPDQIHKYYILMYAYADTTD